NTVFLVAHFHNVIVPGVLFGLIAAYHFWFPKVLGFRLDERWGMVSAFCWIFGFMLAFFPLYALGLMGMPRRTVAYTQPAYVPLEMAAFAGALLILAGFTALVIQLAVSILRRDENRVFAGDPWDGRSLEWAVSAPPPEYDFAVIPTVNDRDAFTAAKEFGVAYEEPLQYVDIELPKNSWAGPILGAVGFVLAFALVWHIWWLVLLAVLGGIVAMIARGFERDTVKVIPAEEVRRTHRSWLEAVHAATAISRDQEYEPTNQGVARPVVIEATS
ncbi:MAG: cbb3-type cytochrome c oxidase subunit I, partial [Pseudonocardiaceae bacterium]